MNIAMEFRKCRRVGTPTVLVQTPDYRNTMKMFMGVSDLPAFDGNPAMAAEDVPCVFWDCVRGHTALNQAGKEVCQLMGTPDETSQAPMNMLNAAHKMPVGAVLFMCFPNNEILSDPSVAQGIANLRDVFKADHRSLVIFGERTLLAPTLVRDDIPILQEELPDDTAIKEISKKLHTTVKLKEPNYEAVLPLCRGLTAFAIEDAIARNLTKSGLDLDGLATTQRLLVEGTTNNALKFERQKMTFDDVGGLSYFRKIMTCLFKGPRRPQIVIRIDEIDKVITAASTGTVADNTGTAQEMLGEMLKRMEDNRWTGCFLLGCPGSGKTLSTICTGNEFGVKCIACDLNATKTSALGESGRNLRTLLDMAWAMGGENVLWLATCNRIDTMPPELLRRFNMGKWFFPMPNKEELKLIWQIQMKKYAHKEQKLPSDTGWTGSNIRDCCENAYMLGMPLIEAAKMISPTAKTAARDIERIESLAEECGWLCASYEGPYTKKKTWPGTVGGRSISLDN